MNLHDAISIFLERGTAMQTFWGFYITVAIGLVALFANIKPSRRLPHLAALVSFGFIAFAYVNCDGMTAIAAQREFFYCAVERVSLTGQAGGDFPPALLEQFRRISEPPSARSVMAFHIGADIAVLVAIWLLTLWPVKRQMEE